MALLIGIGALGFPTQSLVGSPGDVQSIATHHKARPQRASHLDHVVIVAIDGVRWEEVFLGLDRARLSASERSAVEASSDDYLTEIRAIAGTRGILIGSDSSRVFVSSASAVSLPGYAELFSGRTPTCHDNDCPATQTSTLLDELKNADPGAVIALVSSWSPLVRVAANTPSHLVISAGRDQESNLENLRAAPHLRRLLDLGRNASPIPGTGSYRPDCHTAAIALEVLERLHPNFLFIGLGDTDEYAHQNRYSSYVTALREADRTVGHVHRWLEHARSSGKRTLLVVTTDHGRASSFRNHANAPEARRIWMLLSGTPVTHWGRPSMRDSRLADLAQTLRAELDLSLDRHRDAGALRLDWFRSKAVDHIEGYPKHSDASHARGSVAQR
ncbi:MAG: hypothetical protein QM784_04800 [Polyangiaceae bacterium]